MFTLEKICERVRGCRNRITQEILEQNRTEIDSTILLKNFDDFFFTLLCSLQVFKLINSLLGVSLSNLLQGLVLVSSLFNILRMENIGCCQCSLSLWFCKLSTQFLHWQKTIQILSAVAQSLDKTDEDPSGWNRPLIRTLLKTKTKTLSKFAWKNTEQ